MAVTRQDYTQPTPAGTQTQYTVPFVVIEPTDIDVYVNSVLQLQQNTTSTADATHPQVISGEITQGTALTNYTVAINNGTITFNAVLTAGDYIVIERTTDTTSTATFVSGSTIRAKDLNDSFDQIRFLAEEAVNTANRNVIESRERDNSYTAQGYKIEDLADADSDDDAVNRAQLGKVITDDLLEGEAIDLTDVTGGTNSNKQVTISVEDSSKTNKGAVSINEAHAIGVTYTSGDAVISADKSTSSQQGVVRIQEQDNGANGNPVDVNYTADGEVEIGIADNTIDFAKLKDVDIVTESEQDLKASTNTALTDTELLTGAALSRRNDVIVNNTGINPAPPSSGAYQPGKFYYHDVAGERNLKVWDGDQWRTVSPVGEPFSPTSLTIIRYVDAVNGFDGTSLEPNPGYLPHKPLKTIEKALDLVNNDSTGDGTIIFVDSGVYKENLPLVIKKQNVSIIGRSMRSCFVMPKNDTESYKDMFHVDSGSYIAFMTLLGLKINPSTRDGARNYSLDNDATYGLPTGQNWSVRFRTDITPTLLKSPYIQNCTHFSDAHLDIANFDPNSFPSTDSQTYSAVAGDQTSAPSAGGLLVDGSACSSASPIRSMVVDAFTQITLDGPGILVTNNGYAQLVSFFGTFSHYHAKAKNGGQVNLSNCVSDFGRYGLIADGHGDTFATATASAASTGATVVTVSALTTTAGHHVTATEPLDHMMITIDGNDYGVVSSTANGSGWDVTITPALSQNISNTSTSFSLRSYISTGGHTFEYVGVGTNYGDHPDKGGKAIEANQAIELNGGKVWLSSTDHIGKFKAGTTLVVDQVSETVDLKDTTVTGNITVTGTVDGRDIATDGTKLDGIETGATADQTDAEIKTAYENNADTNAFTDAEQTKLSGVAAGAEVNVNADWNSSSGDSEILNKPTIPAAYTDSSVDTHLNTSTASSNEVLSWTGSDYDWVAQSGGGGGAVDSVNTQTGVVVLDADDISDTSTTNKFTTAGEAAKLAGIATGAIANVVEDTAPQLGGPLDVQAQEINTSTTNGNIKLTPDGTGVVEIKGNTGNDAAIQLNCEQNTHGVKIKSPPHSAAASYTLTLPDDTGTSNQLLTTDGSGNLSWSSSGGITDSSGNSTSIGIGSSTALDAETTTGGHNIAIGANALTELTAGHGNIAIGLDAFKSMVTSNISSFGSIAIGSNAGYSFLSTGGGIFGNCYIGFSAGRLSGTTGQPGAVTHVGSYAGQYDSGTNSTSFGYRALSGMGSTAPSTGHNNIYSTAIGAYSLLSSTGSNFCTAVGTKALEAATATSSNTAIGSKSLFGNTSGDSNTAVGANSGLLAQGDNNTFIGYNAGDQLVGAAGSTGENNIIIGNEAQASTTTVNDEITIGNTSIDKFRVPGINFILKDNASLPSTGQVLTADSNGEGYWADASGGSGGAATVDTTSLNTNFAINPDNGTMLIDQITANRTYTDDMDSGESVTIMVSRSSVNHSITWPTIKWVGGSQPILPTGSTAYAIITVWKAGTTLFGSYGGDAS